MIKKNERNPSFIERNTLKLEFSVRNPIGGYGQFTDSFLVRLVETCEYYFPQGNIINGTRRINLFSLTVDND